jgi:hypothetical protein
LVRQSTELANYRWNPRARNQGQFSRDLLPRTIFQVEISFGVPIREEQSYS